MRLEFQKIIAGSPFTLPIVSAVAIAVWLLFRPSNDEGMRLWMGMGASAFAVYLLAELNNRNVLLRISSRFISSLFAVLLAVIVQLHSFQLGHVVLVLSLVSFFPFFQMYQSASPFLSFFTYLPLALVSLVFPPILFLVPVYWLCQMYMRGFSLKSGVASLLALAFPYWMAFGVRFFFGEYDAWIPVQMAWPPVFSPSFSLSGFLPIQDEFTAADIHANYENMSPRQIVQFVYILLLLAVGIVDLFLKKYLDKTRTRILYHVIVIHALFVIFLLLFQMQYFYQLFPLLVADAAIMGGHFMAQTYNRFSHVFSILFLMASLAVCFISYIS